jgi:hypothetical protein
MTRARWVTGALIGAAAVIVAGEAFATYVAERLVVGIVAVVVLMGVLAIGLASLAGARRYIGRELSALRGETPSGALYEARRSHLVALRRHGVEPDLDVLADATAADEAERGYTGRYLVATTVLIGLVGTFGGLMETLGRVAPLLKGELPSSSDGPAGAFALIAGPLAGLHVTFATSVVAILVTLALALIQGDVTLHHERLLALLHERTRHVLVPELWPAEQSAGARTVHALGQLQAFVAESLTASSSASAERIAGVVRLEVQRLVAQIGTETRAAAAAQTAALERTGAHLTDELRRTTEAAAHELRDAATTSRETMTAAATVASETMTAAARASRESVDLAATASRQAFESAAAATREEMAAAIAALASTTARTSESIATSTGAAVASLGELRGSLGTQLEGSSRALATAAADLRGTAGVLSTTLADLAPQLGALGAEIALLAARADSPEQSNAVLDELVHLGEDVERLLAASQRAAAATKVAAHEAES